MRPGRLAASFLAMSVVAAPLPAAEPEDPYRWLEAVDGRDALAWVEARNAVSSKELQGDPSYRATEARVRAILDSKERIPAIEKVGERYYNFWRDASHVRGILRRTTLDEYRKREPAWETVIDLDAIASTEGENWVWKGWTCRYPDHARCFVSLSRGGGDAVVVRELDLATRTFVAPADGGFVLPESKGSLSWIDEDHAYVRTDFGPGTLTDSGYPRIVRRWTRGTPLADAVEVLAGERSDVSVSAVRYHDRVDGGTSVRTVYRTLAHRSITFYSGETWFVPDDGPRVRLEIPDDATAHLWRDHVVIVLRSAWPTGRLGNDVRAWPAGALLVMPFGRFLDGRRDFAMLYAPGPRRSLGSVAMTRNAIVVGALDDVKNEVVEWTRADGRWVSRPVAMPSDGTIAFAAVDDDASDDYLVTTSDALTPTTLSLARVGTDAREPLKALPAFFDAGGMRVLQLEARSRDGTRIPYVVVAPRGFDADGGTPTILYGYGGFEISLLPRAYGAVNGSAWLARGGAFVVAGIRGGGEFGPGWHDAAIKANKHRSHDDFVAVAEDLIARGVSSPSHLGIMGGSNGGLLVGAVALQRPELFKAVVCQVPLLDMRRYHRLLAGASWMAEYGDPDVADDWASIAEYSPYQNVSAAKRYPRFLFTTSTRDDRVHPGHARKMAARMLEQDHDVLYYENTEGGHAGAADNIQQARMNALEYTFLWRELR